MERQYRVKMNLLIYAESWEEAQRCAVGALSNCDEHGDFEHINGIGGARGRISFEHTITRSAASPATALPGQEPR